MTTTTLTLNNNQSGPGQAPKLSSFAKSPATSECMMRRSMTKDYSPDHFMFLRSAATNKESGQDNEQKQKESV